ncbi:integrase [Vibrio lentus]|uniref:integrase n=1 Tax=Vibrio lentus TaxID=136468 RepID=UPI000C845BE3|nr:integrase [Vibrio lentus]PMM38011.1 integrase [Vibrio lentus]
MIRSNKKRSKLHDQTSRFFHHHYFGIGKTKTKESKLIHGRRTYAEQIRIISKAAYDLNVKKLKFITPQMAQSYLKQCAQRGLSQKYLSTIKMALERVVFIKNPDQRLDRVEAKNKSKPTLKEVDRAYTNEQLHLILPHLSSKGVFSVLLAFNAGLRAEELLTIQRRDEAAPSPHREWSEHRFMGKELGIRYVVTGKNGLKREIMIEEELAGELERLRFESPQLIYDRKQPFHIHYDVLGGKRFSEVFSEASKKALGWSHGAHGLRFSYAQRRMDEELFGLPYKEAKLVVSQELGHFREHITERYIDPYGAI